MIGDPKRPYPKGGIRGGSGVCFHRQPPNGSHSLPPFTPAEVRRLQGTLVTGTSAGLSEMPGLRVADIPLDVANRRVGTPLPSHFTGEATGEVGDICAASR